MKKLLIISPYFAPVNAADMQRIRMSLPYFAGLGWEAEVVTVDERYADISKDELLLKSVPAGIKIHKVKAFNKKWTSKFGLGSIALRSFWYYKKTVDALLKASKYELIYFSTTQFPVCILGAYWKKKFQIPYVIDLQDPWHSDYYQDKPKAQRPAKHWFSYRLNKYLEPIAVKNADGLISVSAGYITNLKNRYPAIKDIPSATITFGAFEPDLRIAAENEQSFQHLLDKNCINIVYVGRGGADLHKAISPFFEALKQGLILDHEIYSRIKLYFIGTSYAATGGGKETIRPLAQAYSIENQVIEITDRISYYHTLITLQQADGLFIPGSDDPKYTASKIYPYVLTQKPLLALFNPASSVISILKEYGLDTVYDYELVTKDDINAYFSSVLKSDKTATVYRPEAIEKYSAQQMTRNQCALFDQVLHG